MTMPASMDGRQQSHPGTPSLPGLTPARTAPPGVGDIVEDVFHVVPLFNRISTGIMTAFLLIAATATGLTAPGQLGEGLTGATDCRASTQVTILRLLHLSVATIGRRSSCTGQLLRAGILSRVSAGPAGRQLTNGKNLQAAVAPGRQTCNRSLQPAGRGNCGSTAAMMPARPSTTLSQSSGGSLNADKWSVSTAQAGACHVATVVKGNPADHLPCR
jgi:hypothetical protein